MNLLERRRALMNVYRSLLPKEYQRVEYLESKGTQYINTGLKNIMGKFEVDFARNDTTSSVYILGTRQNGTVNSLASTTNYNLLWQFGGAAYADIAWNLDTNRHKVIAEASANELALSFDGTTKSAASSITSNTLNVYLFGRNNDGVLQAIGGMKLYCFRYWNEYGKLTRDFVPCYRKSDNKSGLYDLVNGEFYTNQGTGEFLIGGEI